jgi:hypothetical protein
MYYKEYSRETLEAKYGEDNVLTEEEFDERYKNKLQVNNQLVVAFDMEGNQVSCFFQESPRLYYDIISKEQKAQNWG